MSRWDVILVGGGLANGLIAWRMLQRQPGLSVLMLECGEEPGGNHTWSFHQDDITEEQHRWLAPFVVHRWEGYDVHFPAFQRTVPGGYFTLTSSRFAALIRQTPGLTLMTETRVNQIAPGRVQLADGRILDAAAVIDGRGFQQDSPMTLGWQAFLGQEWQLSAPHGLTRPILMDATVDQLAGYRFVYTLPLTPDTVLIEDTHYIDQTEMDSQTARERIAAWASSKGWTLSTLQREEQGSLPITLMGKFDRFWQQQQGQPCSGLRAGLYHPTTGYSLPLAVQLADAIAAVSRPDSAELYGIIRQFAQRKWRSQRFFRLLNRMLFLAGEPAQRWQVMQRFYRLDDALIRRFYAGQPTWGDMARVLTGKPPVPVGEALLALSKKTKRLRTFK